MNFCAMTNTQFNASVKTPYDVLFKDSPSFAHLKVFGCLCYAHHNQKKKDKFDSRSRRCIFVGYPYARVGRCMT